MSTVEIQVLQHFLYILSLFPFIYSVGEETSPYFLFHGETALCRILKFQEETVNFSEKFQGEITEFLRENMELHKQNLKISWRNTGISWRKYWISWRNLEKFSTISPRKKHYFSQKKGGWSWRKMKVGIFLHLHCMTYANLKIMTFLTFHLLTVFQRTAHFIFCLIPAGCGSCISIYWYFLATIWDRTRNLKNQGQVLDKLVGCVEA